MSRWRPLLVGAIPFVCALLAAAVFVIAGEQRQVRLMFSLPGLVLLLGAGVSIVLLGILYGRHVLARTASHARQEEADRHAKEHRQFLARLDHELKNPLTAILAAAASERPDAFQMITAQARRMGILVTDLRKLADLASAPLEMEDVDIEETARDAVDAARAAVGQTREFDLVFPKAPWPLPHVRGDVDLLYSAIQNVVMNAVKYSEPGARIEVRAHQVDRAISLEVADTGIGVPAAETDTVWGELARGSNSVGRQGSGLGLALVKLVVERHGGHVRMDSREGVGTVVTMTLPLPEGAAPVRTLS